MLLQLRLGGESHHSPLRLSVVLQEVDLDCDISQRGQLEALDTTSKLQMIRTSC